MFILSYLFIFINVGVILISFPYDKLMIFYYQLSYIFKCGLLILNFELYILNKYFFRL